MSNEADEIIDALRRFREAHAAKFEYDLKRIAEDLRTQEQASGAQVVIRPSRPALTGQPPTADDHDLHGRTG